MLVVCYGNNISGAVFRFLFQSVILSVAEIFFSASITVEYVLNVSICGSHSQLIVRIYLVFLLCQTSLLLTLHMMAQIVLVLLLQWLHFVNELSFSCSENGQIFCLNLMLIEKYQRRAKLSTKVSLLCWWQELAH